MIIIITFFYFSTMMLTLSNVIVCQPKSRALVGLSNCVPIKYTADIILGIYQTTNIDSF